MSERKKEKLESLLKYESQLKDRLAAEIPAKHKNHPKEYKIFLANELRLVSSSISKLKLNE